MAISTTARAVLLDADGVLVDSHAGHRDVWQRWSQLHQLDPVVVLAATHARRPVDTVAEVAPHLDAITEHTRLVDYVNDLPGAFPVFPDAGDLLALLAPERWAGQDPRGRGEGASASARGGASRSLGRGGRSGSHAGQARSGGLPAGG